ncbi:MULTISPECIES: dihydroxyacetone kinase phosphoryl donor subunit DhaM [unclassified Streptococcus]|uniref:dihydroxyacetone kinase phosphoryl donor subunit DhaM n=1 Tax=unclassified Streptococcus TaxID=2608887 RepID=UPI00107173B5|nr:MULTISPECIES: dihydroxyacetone kinase phosphoryl donor subunit DhaM [unclassified Streptococcus]MBF0787221.1 PTS-dependent dihydroxyacetone kinase phosphotransferase subunit DhaM [Streptococcus sp. 19428wC2_LYSM12]MCQ9211907.1 PTS-dependent dihydroxyacetone kinase phosphotransferase subunit DhaM [Streptococcus sp. B01]MCQ9213237.1 PTS-dependent dihydroxyacetone kinase phosphotransferase subunit DhaM [Streptococcus sp. O1]TFV05850.1 PTS-dependent dihydroxyacetone kinase phosphotransferase sub
MTQTIGIVIVSHSHHLAQGIIELLSEIAKDVPITYCGGLEDGSIGTEFSRVEEAVNSNPADIILAFFDLGSARMNMAMVAEFTDKDIRIQSVSVVEGSYTAAALLQAGASLEAILEQLTGLQITK